MNTSSPPPSPQQPPAPAPPAPPHAGQAPGDGLDLEEDVAPNLGGEDQMQDA
jgi:hypothetical protein